MSLVKLPNEMVYEIGLYLLPDTSQLGDKPFHVWASTIRNQGSSIMSQSRDLLALGLGCKQIRDALPKIHHANVRHFNVDHLSSIFKDLKIKSLTANNIYTGWITQEEKYLLPAHLQEFGPGNTGTSSYLIPPLANKSIHTLYILKCAAFSTPFKWLLQQLEGLKMLYINFQHHSSQYEFGGQSLTFSDAMELMEIHAPKIEKLVLTQSDYDLPDDPTLGSYSLPIKLTNLTSLSISSFLLFGGENHFDHRKEMHAFLPPSLVDFEVFYDRGDYYHYSFMGYQYRGDGLRPYWLFQLLREKKKIIFQD